MCVGMAMPKAVIIVMMVVVVVSVLAVRALMRHADYPFDAPARLLTCSARDIAGYPR
jgi:hypothetical protein